MLSVKILGPGCSKCRTLERKVRELIEKNNIHAEVLKIEEIAEMMNYGIMMTPALVVNEKVKSFGIVPKDDQILKWIKEA